MATINLELSAQQYANIREALSFLEKSMKFNPDLYEESVLTFGELNEIDRTLEDQCSQAELTKLLITN